MATPATRKTDAKPATGRSSIAADTVAAVARTKKSSALFVLACIFLATGVLRANEFRHDLASLVAAPAHAASNPGAGAHGEPHNTETEHAKAATPAMPAPSADHTKTQMTHSTTPVAETAGHDDTGNAPPAGPTDPKSMHAGANNMAMTKPDNRCLTGAFLAAALEREQELNAMALQIDGRKRELEVTEKRVAAQVAELTQQQNALAAAFGQADAAAEQEAMQLVSIYEKMKPKQASQIFDQMPPEVGAGFVRRMRQTSSAQIMANMDPQKAYAISLLLAGRSSAVRKQ